MNREKIDDLRNVLDLHDRGIVSWVALTGVIETTKLEDMVRSFADSGDRAFVIVGPKDKLNIVQIEDKETGQITYTITMPMAKP